MVLNVMCYFFETFVYIRIQSNENSLSMIDTASSVTNIVKYLTIFWCKKTITCNC